MLTRCLGRDQVLHALDRALATSRWVSVVGPHGGGKSLVVRHATSSIETTWVSVTGLCDSDRVLNACLAALDVERAPGDGLQGALRRALDDTATLLVIDGLEVEDEILGPVLQDLVEATTRARVVVTATSHSGLPGERVVKVGPLTVPGLSGPLRGPAVDLFASRIREAGGQVDLVRHEDDVRRLLRATGGLPLLIEQVAIQCALLGVTGVAPQATLTEAFSGSYQVLSPEAQRCFRRVAHIGAPAGIEVISEVCELDPAQSRDVVAGLVRRNLLETHADGRFALLAPVRHYALTCCEGTDDRARCRAGLLRWADRVAPEANNVGASDAPWLADLAAMRTAIAVACESNETRDLGYSLANRVFSSLYTSMRAREAVEILESTLVSGDGPGAIGAQVARRAGIAASEVRGTYEGLWLLDRADEHAHQAQDPGLELARNASIRAEMHLDAGDFTQAEAEALRALELDTTGRGVARQALRTLVDLHVSRGEFSLARERAGEVIPPHAADDERWIGLSARILLGRTALEQGRLAEAEAFARTAATESRELAEDRVRLLAETLLRQVDPSAPITTTERTTLPWAVRLPVLLLDARDLLESGDLPHAAGLAADVVALADSARLGRDAVEGRLILAWALSESGDHSQAAQTFRTALEQAAGMPMPLRVADALDGLAMTAEAQDLREGRSWAATAAAIRAQVEAVPWGLTARRRPVAARVVPAGWLAGCHLTEVGLRHARLGTQPTPDEDSPLEALTRAEREVATRVSDGLTSRQIAEDLFVSPRTVDSHLTNIYRKLDINTRARLAAMVADVR